MVVVDNSLEEVLERYVQKKPNQADSVQSPQPSRTRPNAILCATAIMPCKMERARTRRLRHRSFVMMQLSPFEHAYSVHPT